MESITTCCIWISQWLQALLQWAEPQRFGFQSCCGAAAACGDIDLDLLRANHAAPDGASEMVQAMRQWHPAWIGRASSTQRHATRRMVTLSPYGG